MKGIRSTPHVAPPIVTPPASNLVPPPILAPRNLTQAIPPPRVMPPTLAPRMLSAPGLVPSLQSGLSAVTNAAASAAAATAVAAAAASARVRGQLQLQQLQGPDKKRPKRGQKTCPACARSVGPNTRRCPNTACAHEFVTKKTTKRCPDCSRSINHTSQSCVYCRRNGNTRAKRVSRGSKSCPQCHKAVGPNTRKCPECPHVFPFPTRKTTKRCPACQRSINRNSRTCLYCRVSIPPEDKTGGTPGSVGSSAPQPPSLSTTHSAAFLGRRDVIPRLSPGVIRPTAPRVPAANPARPGATTRGPLPLARGPNDMERRNAAAVAAAAAAAASGSWVMLKEKAAQQKSAIINA